MVLHDAATLPRQIQPRHMITRSMSSATRQVNQKTDQKANQKAIQKTGAAIQNTAVAIQKPGVTIEKPMVQQVVQAECAAAMRQPADAFGLVNTREICWFNSLIQSLISVPQFVSTVRTESAMVIADTVENRVLIAFALFLRTIAQPYPVQSALPILGVFANLVKDFGHRQEDAHEGFHLLIDKMPPAVGKIFESQWCVDLYCDTCKHIVSHASGLEKMIQVIMEREFIPIEASGDPFMQFLSGHMTFLEGYKCPKCTTVGRAMRIARLVQPPDVLVVSFNKYTGKWESPPYSARINVNYMPRPKISEMANYDLVAIIHHLGNMNGGHYTSMGMRSSGIFGFNDESIVHTGTWKSCMEDYMLFYARNG
jgi:ubiquitin C-terminal hydrolase